MSDFAKYALFVTGDISPEGRLEVTKLLKKYNVQTIYSNGCWCDISDFLKNTFWKPVENEDIHQGLDCLPLVNSTYTKLLVLWLVQEHDSDDQELLGALLRCYLCHKAVVLAINPDSSPVTWDIGSLWITDFMPITLVTSLFDIDIPLWNGYMCSVIAASNSPPCFVNIYADDDGGSPHSCFPHNAICLELITKLELSSIDVTAFGVSHKARIASSQSSFFISQPCGYLVRTVCPLSVCGNDRNSSDIDINTAKEKRTITSTEQWIACVLEGQLPNPDEKPVGPVWYRYYLLHQADADSLYLVELDMQQLSNGLLQVDRNPAAMSATESLLNSADPPDLGILHYMLSSDDESYPSLTYMKPSVSRCLMEYDNTKEYDLLDKPQLWPEKAALKDFTRRKNIERKSLTTVADSSHCSKDIAGTITLSAVVDKFYSDGRCKDTSLNLPEGNCETPGIRGLSWPTSFLYFGPGIGYHRDSGGMIYDHRMVLYRDRHGFSETASIFTSDVIPALKEDSKTCPSKRSSSYKSSNQPSRYDKLMNHTTKSTRRTSSRDTGYMKTSQSSSRQPVDSTNTTTLEQASLPVQMAVPQVDEDSSVKSINRLSRKEKMERNQKNQQRMKSAIEKALRKQGMKPDHKSYNECYEQLHQVTYAAVKKLKTSHNLDKNMKDITNKFAPLMVATFKEKD